MDMQFYFSLLRSFNINYGTIFQPITLALIVAIICYAFYFAKKHGSKSIFLSIPYVILFFGLLILTFLFLGLGHLLPVSINFGELGAGLGPFLLLLHLPFYIVISVIIYFFWPDRFEPTSDTSIEAVEKHKKFKRWTYAVLLFEFVALPALFLVVFFLYFLNLGRW